MAKAEEFDVERLIKILQEVYPVPEDLEGYVGDVVTAPASVVTTVTYTLKDYFFYVKKLYIDAAADCVYEWLLNNVLGYGYQGTKTLDGNEHEFLKRLVLKGGSKIQVTITNTSASAFDLDIVLEMWTRRERSF